MMKNNDEAINNQRHTAAHLLAAAVLELYPDAKLGIGPTIDNGFYYDILFSDEKPFNQEDLKAIEKRMKKMIQANLPMTGSVVSYEQAQEALDTMGQGAQQFKTELLRELRDSEQDISLYTIGEFTDLCRGGHSQSSGELCADGLKLQSVAGAYWKGSEANPMLTRIYGLLFDSKEELSAHLTMLEEAKKRDHRKIGQELGLFTFSPLVGSGLPLFTPHGTRLRDGLIEFSESLQRRNGFEKVWIPVIAKNDLYKTSGHWDKFGDELFLVKSQETTDEFVLKPMNCPHHTQIYASAKRSYRELPLRFFETTTIYRDEKAGELLGLSRVRSITQDDAHVFATMDQIEQEFTNIMTMIDELYATLGLTFRARLSFRDPEDSEKYLGDEKNWNMAEQIIESVAQKLELDYHIAIGEAAFYGPKIDIMVIDALGREWQCATQQLDFVQPARFGLTYTAADGSEQTPVMIHKALLGSVERFISIYLEHTVGVFPLWLAPVQIQLISVGETHRDFVDSLATELKNADLRVSVDHSDESVGKKIRNSTKQKIPYVLVIGDKEMQSTNLMVRKRGEEEAGEISKESFIARCLELVHERSQEL